jgi:hypothetical protein
VKGMQVTAPGKLLLLAVIAAGSFVALCVGALSETTFVAIVGPISGYLVGNGVGAVRGEPSVPVFTPAPRDPDMPVGDE